MINYKVYWTFMMFENQVFSPLRFVGFDSVLKSLLKTGDKANRAHITLSLSPSHEMKL